MTTKGNMFGASNLSAKDRADLDFYGTPPDCVNDLLEREAFSKNIWEPACGSGLISKTLKDNGFKVLSSDIIDRGYNDFVYDFLSDDKIKLNSLIQGKFDIITNPPYKSAQKFIERAIEYIADGHKIAMLLKLTFIESGGRFQFFQMFPPKIIYAYSRRRDCWPNGIKPEKESHMIAYAWFIWEKRNSIDKHDTILDWIF